MAKKKDDEKVVPMEAPPPEAGEWTEQDFVRQLEDIMYKNIRERLGPVLDTYFTDQRDQIAEIMDTTISKCYKVMLEHTIDEQVTALAELKKDDGDGGHESEADKAFNDEHEKKKDDDDEVLRSTT